MTPLADVYGSRPRRGSALADQLQAAEVHAHDLAVLDGFHLGADGPGRLFNAERGTGPVRKITDRFREADESDQMTWCRHLKPGSPQPAVWQAWRPSRLYCTRCAVQLPALSSKEDRRCDACRHVGSKIWPHRLTIPGRALPARQGEPQEVRSPVVVMFGLCGRCQAKADAAAAELAAAIPCTFRLPSLGRHADAVEAGLFRTATDAARAVSSGDLEAISGLEVGVLPLLWAVAALVVMLTRGILDQAPWTDPAARPKAAELWDSIPATLARWESYESAGLDGPRLREQCTAAVNLIKQLHRGDDSAFGALDGGEDTAALLGGATWVLATVVQWPLQAGLAADAGQIYAELLAGIERWEAGE